MSNAYFVATRDWLVQGVGRVRARPQAALLTLLTLTIPMLLFVVLNDRMMKTPLGYDEQFFVWGGWNITRGQRLYIDFFEFKPPMVFITHALGVALAGSKGLHYRVVFSVLALISLTLLHLSLLSRKIPRPLSLAFILAFTFQWVNPYFHDNALQDAESIGLIYYCTGIAALLAHVRRRPVAEVIGAALLALTAISKEPFTGGVIGAWATCFLIQYGTIDFRKNALSYLKYTMLGVALAIVGLSLYMGPTGSLTRYVHLVIEYAKLFRDPKTSYCVMLGRWTPGTLTEELSAQIKYINAQFFNVPTLGYLAPFFIGTFVFAWRGSKVLLVAGVITAMLSQYGVTATNCQWPHYYNLALPGLFLFFLIGVDRMKGRVAAAEPVVRRALYALFIGVPVVFMIPRISAEFQGFPHEWNTVTDPVPGAFDFVAKHTAPTDKIFYTGPPAFYMFADRLAAVNESSILDDFLIYLPGNTDEEKVSDLRQQLIRSKPKVVILDPENGHRKYRYMKALIEPFLSEFKYQQVGPYFYLRPN